jgi:putative ABC transport system substrate-binding protein
MARDQGAYTSRRSFCWTLAGVLVAPGIAIAQAARVRRIGVLDPSPPDPPEWLWKQAGPLRELGWVEGQNLDVERRFANLRFEALQPLAAELVRAQVEIIVTDGTAAALAAKRATTTIPIVFSVGDPVLVGLVPSLARPGGNLTGVSQASPEVTTKYLSVLKELLPRLQSIGVLWDLGNPWARAIRSQFEHVCQSLGLVPISVEIDAASEISGVIAGLVQRRVEALLLPGQDIIHERRFDILDAAMKHGLPTMADDPAIVREAGALIAYSATWAERFRLRAQYIDRILRGARPADLPVQQPTKFEMVINLRTAKALGLTIPQALLLRADEVIQ